MSLGSSVGLLPWAPSSLVFGLICSMSGTAGALKLGSSAAPGLDRLP